jgi:hypothetical protein
MVDMTINGRKWRREIDVIASFGMPRIVREGYAGSRC